jgi:hypothetical protein
LQPRQARRPMPNNNLVTVEVEYVPGDLLTPDVPGIEDALWHLLERLRVLLNDRCPVNVMWKAVSSDRDSLVCV